jgi:hypothetical protein
MSGRVSRMLLTAHLRGARGTVASAAGKVVPVRVRNLQAYRSALAGQAGLEVGGPSPFFGDRGQLPVYDVVARLDNCNFATATVWESVTEGETFRFHPDKPAGRQLVAEATDLSALPAASYDFVLSSNALEHVANPIRALEEWLRVTGEDGHLVLVLPHRATTFDHLRPVTPLDHLVADYEQDTGEDDLTHLDEILALHDLRLDPPAGDAAAFRERSLDNVHNRCLHHHVFDTASVVDLLDHVGVQILSVDPVLPSFVAALARKPAAGAPADNARFRAADAEFRRTSPFPADRR